MLTLSVGSSVIQNPLYMFRNADVLVTRGSAAFYGMYGACIII
jgi:hypothetical protein